VKDADKHRQKMQEVAKGQTSTIVLNELRPELDQMEKAATSKLKHLYREGNRELGLYLAEIAQLCMIDDLEIRLKQRVQKGMNAAKETMT